MILAIAMAQIAVLAAQPTKLHLRVDDGDHKAPGCVRGAGYNQPQRGGSVHLQPMNAPLIFPPVADLAA